MNKFEAVIIFNPDLSNPILDKEDNTFISTITKADGNIVSTENWGLKDLSYNINNYKKGFYKYYQLEIDGVNFSNIKKTLTQNEKILRHLFVKVDKHQTLPTKMAENEEK